MKNAEPRTESSHGAQTPSQAVGASPVRSAREPIPRQSVEDNLLSNSLPFKDQTGDFLHQLSQTLTSLRGFLELALLVDSDAQEYRKVIQQSLAQAETLVQLFKSYRALGEGSKRPCEWGRRTGPGGAGPITFTLGFASPLRACHVRGQLPRSYHCYCEFPLPL